MEIKNYLNRVVLSASITALVLFFQFVALNITHLKNFSSEIFEIIFALILVSILSSSATSALIKQNKLALVIASQMGAILMIGAMMYWTS